MGYKEVQSLDAEVTIAIGKVNKETGKPYPKQAEGYFLGNRKVENKRGESVLHFLQTPEGNLGVWGTTDLNRKLNSVPAGAMVRITSTGKKPTPNGDMYTYKVEVDASNTIEVDTAPAYTPAEDDSSDANDGFDSQAQAESLAAELAAKQAKVQEIMNRGKSKTK